MNILYMTIKFPKEEESDNLYTDLAETLVEKGHNVTVIVPESKENIITIERNMEVLRVKTGRLFNVGIIEKGISFITMQYKIKKAIKRYLDDRNYDMILYTSPPVTISSVVRFAMKKYKAISYLMQKDIFPQNALDLKILTKWNPAYWYFKYREFAMYKTASIIGCMSEGNIEYLRKNNKYLKNKIIELFYNTAKLIKDEKEKDINVRKKYKISEDEVLAVYGGNFGVPQGIDFIIKILEHYKNDKRIKFLFCGTGTEKEKLFRYVKDNEIKNVITLEYMPREEYEKILRETDIGLVFLDYRFTIPNIPSRTISYLQRSIPIMAATDKNTDYKDVIEKNQIGKWAYSNDLEDFNYNFEQLINNPKERKKMGRNGKEYFEKYLITENSVKILEEAYKKLNKEEIKSV